MKHPRSKRPLFKRVLRALILNKLFLLVLSTSLTLEVGLRVFFALKVGPDVLLYGTSYGSGPGQRLAIDPKGAHQQLIKQSHTVHTPERSFGGYRKYRPGQTRSDYTKEGESFAVGINEHGFRGPEFTKDKGQGVIRIITLGASSTFGYRSRDDRTYPVYLQAALNQRLADSGATGKAFEVINLGIPHLWTGDILALLEAEGIPLRPDVVTLYAGMNDSMPGFGFRDRPKEYKLNKKNTKKKPELLRTIYEYVVVVPSDYLITVAALRSLVRTAGTTYPTPLFDDYSAHKVEDFIKNVAAMERMARESGAKFLVATQAAHHSDYDPPVKDVTYQQEVERMEAKRSAGQDFKLKELTFLTQSRLMKRLREWVEEEEVPLVDVIRALDGRRHLMASYVHLTPEANQIVAEAFADAVWAQTRPAEHE